MKNLKNQYDDIIKLHTKYMTGGEWLQHCIHSVFHPTEGTIYYNPRTETAGKTLKEVQTNG